MYVCGECVLVKQICVPVSFVAITIGIVIITLTKCCSHPAALTAPCIFNRVCVDRPSAQAPGMRGPVPPGGLPPNGMEAYHPHAMAAMNLGLNLMAMGGPGAEKTHSLTL